MVANNRAASIMEPGQLVVPDDCRMYGGFTDDRDIRIVLGNVSNDPMRLSVLAHGMRELAYARTNEADSVPPVRPLDERARG